MDVRPVFFNEICFTISLKNPFAQTPMSRLPFGKEKP